MKKSAVTRWTIVVAVLVIGIATGLSIDRTGTGRSSDHSSEIALRALEPPVAIVPASTVETVTEPAVESVGSDEGLAVQRQGLPSLREAAARVRPGVVSVQVTGIREAVSSGFQMPNLPENLPDDMREFFRFQVPQDDTPREVQGEGSGFIFSSDGYIITNNHVVEGATEIVVVMPDKRRYEAELVGTDDKTDVAVIRIDTDEDLHTVELGDSDQLQIGDWVLAIGNPLTFDFTVTAGIVSALGRTLGVGPVVDGVSTSIQNFIQTDAVINRGNSGGPLIDLEGRVVGINTAIASNTGFYEGYGFAIPINLARTVARDLIEYGRVRRSWLGLTFNIIEAPDAQARSLPANPPIGALIRSVTPGGSADEAGVRPDDIILEIDGVPIDNSGKLQTLVSTKTPGTVIEMVVYRGGTSRREGRRLTLELTLQERPPDEVVAETGRTGRSREPEQQQEEVAPAREPDRLGVTVSELERDTAREIGYDGRGVWVTSVERYGPAWDGGLTILGGGVVIVEVDGDEVRNVREYEQVLGELTSGAFIRVRFWIPGQPAGQEDVTFTIQVR
jgi:serine protease Do